MAMARIEEGRTSYGAPAVLLTVPAGRAVVQLHGGQVVDWTPEGQAPVLWMPPTPLVQSGKAVRGGIPICWPWFGTAAGLPSHGTVRTVPWHITRKEIDGDAARVFLQPEASAVPPDIELELLVHVERGLSVVLTTRNDSSLPFSYSEAQHSYFAIAEIDKIRIEGFDGIDYWDQLTPGITQFQDAPKLKQHGPIRFAGEFDRVYDQGPVATRLIDESTGRIVRIDSHGAGTTVVWNPWSAKAERLGDLGPDGWRRMVCIETANAQPAICTVMPGAESTMATQLTLER